jgi:hypothetical protein
LLQQTACGIGWLALSVFLGDLARAEGEAANPLAPQPPHFPSKAKRLIFLLMKGGVSQVDTFDPKPKLTQMNGQPLPIPKPKVQFAQTNNLLKSPWEFKRYGQSGIEVSSLFPNVAACVDDLCVIRSMCADNSAHGGATLQLHTGSDFFVRPSYGAWLTYGLGSENQNLPGFITICPTLGHGGVQNWSSGFLPAVYQGTAIGNAAIPAAQATINNINAQHAAALQRKQLDLLQQLNRDHRARAGHDLRLEGRIESFELAFRMQTAAPELMDISGESKATLDLYGIGDSVTDDFGRQCLLARRFSERGVRVVQATHCKGASHWDQHSDLKKGHENNAAQVDKPIAGLLKDLKARGLLRDTLVVWATEFGRTPTAQGTDGRDHNPHGFCCWLAGGGVKGGMTYGATDDFGYYAVENKVHVHDLHATILHLMGLDHEKLTYRHGGRDFRLTDVYGSVVKEIIA